jgi:hypothetical protein
MKKVNLILLSFFCLTVAWSQLPLAEKTLNVMDFKIVDNDTLKVHWYAAESQDKKSTGAIAFFFGGGWRGGSHTHFQRQALYFSQRGLTTQYQSSGMCQRCEKRPTVFKTKPQYF